VLCSPEVPPRQQLFRDEINEHLRQHGPVPGLTFHYVDSPLMAYWCQRESLMMRRTVYYAGYRAWQRAAYRAATRLHAERPFEIVHQLNSTGFREPGYLWKLPVPFVWGPISGAANVPPPFLAMMGVRERLFYRWRNILNSRHKRTALRCREAARRARQVWAVSDADRELVESWDCPAEAMNEAGASPRPDARPRRRDASRPLRVVWSGQHIGRKALPILLQAIAQLRRAEGLVVDLTVVGDGPESARWRALADELDVGSCTRWTGWLTQTQALAEIARGDVLAFTSVLEGTPHVVLEALSLGLPVVCHEACGMGSAVTDACGIKVRLRDPQTSVDGFAAALRHLALDEPQFARLSAEALERARELSWDAHARRMALTYERVLTAPARQYGDVRTARVQTTSREISLQADVSAHRRRAPGIRGLTR
jgi:glycosyltransferase involved in cell wall biosynthesis